jgi:hypothetical protein
VDDQYDRASRLNDLPEFLYSTGETGRAAVLAGRALDLARSVKPGVDTKTGMTWTVNPAQPLITVAASTYHVCLAGELVAAAKAFAKPSERAEALIGIPAAVHSASDQHRIFPLLPSRK